METGTDSIGGFEQINGLDFFVWEKEHKNGDETHVVVFRLKGNCIAIAIDLEGNGDPIASHLIASTRTEDEAEIRAQDWMRDNPKGIQEGLGSGLSGLLG